MKKIMLLSIILLVLLACSVLAGEFFLKQTLFEGESRNYDVGGYVYHVTLVAVFDSQLKAQFEVNGETTDALGEDEMYKLSDGATIQVREVLPQEAGEGKDLVQFNFFPVAHPEAAAQVAATNVTPEAEPEVTAAEKEPETRPAPAEEAVIDVTKEKPKSWWGRLIEWWKGLFS